MTPALANGDLSHVKVMFELEGELDLKMEGKLAAKAPVQVKAELIYDEKTLRVQATERRVTKAVRQYEKAEAVIQYREGAVRPQLRADRRIVAVTAEDPLDVVLFSPLGPLSRDELDLITVPASSAMINVLLPYRSVAVGETWKLSTDWLAPLVGLDAVHHATVECKLERVENGLAIVHAQGAISGSADGVASEITVAAKYSFDTQRQRISWFAMTLREKRAIGHAHPGLGVTARVQMAVEKKSTVPTLHESVLADLNLDADESARLLEFRSPSGGFEMLLDRRWHVMIEREDVSVLRRVDRGDLIAQCNISALPQLEAGETFSMVDFQQDVKRALADHFGEFVTASESVTESGVHIMRVVATGKISELPIEWVYFHLTDNQGRRASCVYTYESELADRFGAADQSLVSSFHFAEKTAGQVTDAASRPVPPKSAQNQTR
ncbi:MAG: hypothetical protein ACYC3X_00195 [Pirellulaceae bacterium]